MQTHKQVNLSSKWSSYIYMLYCNTTVPGYGEGWDPNMFNPATLFMYVPVPSQEPVIRWLSFVYVLNICFSFIFFLYK